MWQRFSGIVKKSSTVKGRWKQDPMYSQRNNPYCDLLEIMGKYTTFFEQPSVWRCILQQIVHIFSLIGL